MGDQITRFGSLNASNFGGLQVVAAMVKNTEPKVSISFFSPIYFVYFFLLSDFSLLLRLVMFWVRLVLGDGSLAIHRQNNEIPLNPDQHDFLTYEYMYTDSLLVVNNVQCVV